MRSSRPIPENPYAAPLAPLTKEGHAADPLSLPPESGVRRRRIAWAVVFAANLVTPIFFSWYITSEHGRVGMLAAIGLLWLLGHYGCGKSQDHSRTLIVGGACVALSQFFPLLQMFAGLASLSVVNVLGQMPTVGEMPSTPPTELGGFLATTLTGCLLIAVAWLVGGPASRAISLLVGWTRRWTRTPESVVLD